MLPTNKQPLFIVSGASGVGKSTACEILFRRETDYIVMESDLLWHDVYNTPEDDYRAYRELWLRLCASISQIGKPVVLCGCAVPKQFEICDARNLFGEIHYLTVVCDDGELESRMKNGRGISDVDWLKSSADFNRWLKENAEKTEPPIQLLDSTGRSPEAVASDIDKWIVDKLR